jgi:hypothetical protein
VLSLSTITISSSGSNSLINLLNVIFKNGKRLRVVMT